MGIGKSSGELIKENIRLFEEEAAAREFARAQSESTSDSDLLRQSLRGFEHLVDDEYHGNVFEVHKRDGGIFKLTSNMFFDPVLKRKDSPRRSLTLDNTSKERIDTLRERLGLSDISAVARAALRFLTCVITEASKGGRFYVLGAGGDRMEVRFGSFSSRLNRSAVPSNDGRAESEDESSPLPGAGTQGNDPIRQNELVRKRALHQATHI